MCVDVCRMHKVGVHRYEKMSSNAIDNAVEILKAEDSIFIDLSCMYNIKYIIN